MQRTKSILQSLSVAIIVSAAITWFTFGANVGWTKTSKPVKTVDEVTGIEGITYEEGFFPGIDFFAAAVLLSGLLFSVHFLLPKQNKVKNQTTENMSRMNKNIVATLLVTGLASLALAEPQTFDFKDPKGVNNAVFNLDAPLEAITGSANGVSGTVKFDAEKPAATTGKIVVAADTLHVPNPMMKEHLHGAQWMDVAKHKEITFEAKELKNVKTDGNKTTADATGTMTLRGVTKEMTVPVTLTYLRDKLGARTNGQMQGDLLVIRATFTVKRGDFGINPGAPSDKVAEEIELTLSIAGAAAK